MGCYSKHHLRSKKKLKEPLSISNKWQKGISVWLVVNTSLGVKIPPILSHALISILPHSSVFRDNTAIQKYQNPVSRILLCYPWCVQCKYPFQLRLKEDFTSCKVYFRTSWKADQLQPFISICCHLSVGLVGRIEKLMHGRIPAE